MNILYVIPSLSITTGGPAKVAFEYCRELVRQGHDTTIYTTEYGLYKDSDIPRNTVIKQDGITVYYFSLRWPKGYYYSPELAMMLRTHLKSFDIVHIHSVWLYPTAIAGHYCRKYNVPYIIKPGGALTLHCRSKKSFKKKIYNMLIEKNNLKNAAGIHYVNRLEENESDFVCVSNCSIIVPNGVDPKDFVGLTRNGDIRKKYPELINKKVIIFLGRIHPIKGLDRLCHAFVQVLKQEKDVHLLIVGPDEDGYSEKVKEWIRGYGMSYVDYGVKKQARGDRREAGSEGRESESPGVESKENMKNEKRLREQDVHVTFTGMLTGQEKMNALMSSDIFSLPSYHEAHSISITEALMCGLPVIISRASKFDEVEEVNAGIVFEYEPNEITNAMFKLLKDDKLCQSLGENGRRLVREKYTWDKVVEQMVMEYEKILAGDISR